MVFRLAMSFHLLPVFFCLFAFNTSTDLNVVKIDQVLMAVGHRFKYRKSLYISSHIVNIIL